MERMGGGSRSDVDDLLLRDHKRLGYPSFSTMSQIYPNMIKMANNDSLVCDACELGKHTRSSYASSGNKSSKIGDLIHSDVWGPCPTTTMNGVRYFVTFIDCCSRVTWIYLMKNKSDVFACFKDFHKEFQTQFGVVVKTLRSDNGTEYTNKVFGDYLSAQGIKHQTTCPYTPEQNEVAERKIDISLRQLGV